MSETITLKESIERELARRIEREPGLLQQLQDDPDAVLKPMISERLGDDGGLDLSEVSVNVHVETADELHFVIPKLGSDGEDAEVSGYAGMLDAASMLNAGSIGTADLGGSAAFGRRTSTGRRCCTVDPSACKTVNWTCDANTCPDI